MVVQAGGARLILPVDPDRAAEAAGYIEETGRASLAELRSLLGVLDDDLQAGGAPAPAIEDLGALLERSRAAGLTVEFSQAGERPASLPSGVGLATYRIVQEALTNALRHAGRGHASVSLTWADDAVDLDITNSTPSAGWQPPLSSGGHGLVGMQERARLYDGTFEAGPTGDGEYRVRASLRFGAREAQV
jgi:signal transduction histidine kinase